MINRDIFRISHELFSFSAGDDTGWIMNEKKENELRQKQAIKAFLRDYLGKQKDDQTISRILEELGGYYDGDRAYIFELNQQRTHASNTCEWCAKGVRPEIHNLQDIPLEGMECWFEEFEEKGEFYISSLSDDYSPNSKTYQILEPQGIESLMAAPIVVEGNIVGFLGVDNPRRNTSDLLLLSVVASTCYSEITSERIMERRIRSTNQALNAMITAEKQHLAIIRAMSNIFFALYYINLEENTLQTVQSLENSHHMLGSKQDARLFLAGMIEERVAPTHVPVMQRFTALDTIKERLENDSIILQDFTAKQGGWIRCSFFPVDQDEKGGYRTVLCALRNVTAEKEKIESQDNLIQALAIPYENIYAVNEETREAICYRMSQTMNDRYGRKFAAGNYEENISTYIENEVVPQDRSLFDKLRTVSGVNQLLSTKKSYYFNYRVFRGDEICYFQCQLVKPSWERNEFVIGFKNVDQEKKRELAQQREVEAINASLREEMAISDALSREYSSLFKIDAKSGEMSLYRTDGIGISTTVLDKLMKIGDYESILFRYIDTFVVPEDRQRMRQAGSLANLVKQVPDVGLHKIGYRRNMNGVTAYYEMNTAKTVDEQGNITFILGLRDVDEEMRRQLKQTREMETQREIIEGLSSEYYSVLLVSPEADKVTVFRAEKEDGKTIARYFRRPDKSWSKAMEEYARKVVSQASFPDFMKQLALEELQKRTEDYSFTYEKMGEKGIGYIEVRVSFVHEKDGSRAAVIGTRSVDDLIKKERQQEMALQAAFDAVEAANRAKTDFLSNMSHDIRTPMNGIIGMTAIAAAHIDDKDRVQDSLQKITQASKHLLSLINEVLDMSKIESGKIDLTEEEFNLSELVDNLLTMTSAQIEKHHHQLSVNISGVVHEAVIGDSLRIQKVFTNLMGNAVKYTPDGGKIQLTITEKPCAQAKVGCFEFTFEDNGIGMSKEFLDHIFDPFARAEDERVQRIQGTGLGMPITRNIVRMMGGDIKVESTPGVGSCFTVLMYLKLQDTVQERYEKFIDLDVLVADDDPMSLESCCGMLDELGMKAEGVSGGAEAVECAIQRHQQKRDYFACILDWKMPDMDGIATTRAIRRAVGKDVPIIIISAYDWSDIELDARAAGANAFISKPLFRSRLAKTFSALVGEEDSKIQESPMLALEALDFTGRRVLLVEDNLLNAEIATEVLSATGLTIDLALDGIEAVDKMEEVADGYYDLIFMDIQMPRMNGYDATRAIRAMSREYCRQIPIVAMTANAFAEDVQSAKTVGMNAHIAKPLDLNILAKTLSRWLG